MRYKKKIVEIPPDMKVGCKVGVVGEGHDTYEITGIDRNDDGKVTDIHISSGWRESLCKIYLLRGRTHTEAYNDPTSWIKVEIGECDLCGKKFPDACGYHTEKDNPNSMICDGCAEKSQ